MAKLTTISGTTRIFLLLGRVHTARNHSEAPERHFRAAFQKNWQIAVVLLVGIVVLLLHSLDLRAQPRAPQGQSGAQKKEDPTIQAATPPDVVVVPDGTPLTLKLEKDFSSATAKVGDKVEFTTPYPARINGLVFVPKGMAVSGVVVGVSHRRRGARDGEVNITIGKLSLPSGETATLRQVLKSESAGKKIGTAAVMTPAMALSLPFVAWMLPAMLFSKGDERLYPAGTWTTVYFNGPLNLNRAALTNLEPPPYQGPPQIFIKSRKRSGYNVMLFSDQEFVGELSKPVRLELKPGTYSLSTSKAKEHAVQFEAHEDQQYWVEREHGELFVMDPKDHRDEIEEFETAPWVTDRNFTSEAPAYEGPAQVFFVNRDSYVDLFCGQKLLFLLGSSYRVELNPGTYSFSTRKTKGQGVQIEVQEDHQYWIEIGRGKLFIKDFQRLHDDVEHHHGLPIPDLDLTLPSTRGSCVAAALP